MTDATLASSIGHSPFHEEFRLNDRMRDEAVVTKRDVERRHTLQHDVANLLHSPIVAGYLLGQGLYGLDLVDRMAEEESDEFNRLMMALGSVVIMWGMVEDLVRHFLRDVIMEDANAPEIEQIILSETSFRSQLDILRKVAHVRWPNSDWFNAVNYQIRALKGELQDKRNRFIHDLWEKNDAGQIVKFIRGKDETAVQKKEGRWQLKLTGQKAVPAAEVDALFEEIANTYEALHGLKSQFVQWRYEQKEAAIMGNLFRDLSEKTGRIPLSKLASGKPTEDAK